MAGVHAAFSPSSAKRVIDCPASFKACQGEPDNTSFAAVEGTIAHYIHEQTLLDALNGSGLITPEKFEGMRPVQFLPSDELSEQEWATIPDTQGRDPDSDYHWTSSDSEKLWESINWCLAIKGEHYVEQRVNISLYTPIPEQFGTSDHFVIEEGTGTLYVSDLKWGKGVKVFAKKNYQGILYALGVIEEWDWLYGFDKVVIRIAQPRLDHFDVWETTAAELREVGRYILERFTLALDPNAPFNPTEEACKFCAFKAKCPALAQRAQELALGMFDDLDAEIAAPALRDWPLSAPSVKEMTPDEIAGVLCHYDLVHDFLEAVKAQATHMILHGQPVPGWKLVEGKANRFVKDKDGFAAYLTERGVKPYREPELISLTEAEKGLKGKEAKAGLAAFLEKPRGKPTLAPESDKREAYRDTSDAMFEAVDPSDEDL